MRSGALLPRLRRRRPAAASANPAFARRQSPRRAHARRSHRGRARRRADPFVARTAPRRRRDPGPSTKPPPAPKASPPPSSSDAWTLPWQWRPAPRIPWLHRLADARRLRTSGRQRIASARLWLRPHTSARPPRAPPTRIARPCPSASSPASRPPTRRPAVCRLRGRRASKMHLGHCVGGKVVDESADLVAVSQVQVDAQPAYVVDHGPNGIFESAERFVESMSGRSGDLVGQLFLLEAAEEALGVMDDHDLAGTG